MATIHLLRRPITKFSLTSFLTVPYLLHRSRQSVLLCDAPSKSLGNTSQDSKVPVVKEGRVNPRAITQFSTGSVLGVLGGVLVSTFSKTLAILFGLTIFAVQTLETNGIHIVPTTRLQRYFKNFDVRAAMHDNVAFKLAFGATFTLAAFGSL